MAIVITDGVEETVITEDSVEITVQTIIDENLNGNFVLSHSELTNLDADDHPQYLTEARASAYFTDLTNNIAGLEAHLVDVNPHNITASDIGLDQVDNTADLNKPISNATQTALDLKINNSSKGQANGVVPLDSNGYIDTSFFKENIFTTVSILELSDDNYAIINSSSKYHYLVPLLANRVINLDVALAAEYKEVYITNVPVTSGNYSLIIKADINTLITLNPGVTAKLLFVGTSKDDTTNGWLVAETAPYTSTHSFSNLTNSSTDFNNIIIGKDASAGAYGIAIGKLAQPISGQVGIGYLAYSNYTSPAGSDSSVSINGNISGYVTNSVAILSTIEDSTNNTELLNSVSIGKNSKVLGSNSVSLGTNTFSYTDSVSIGSAISNVQGARDTHYRNVGIGYSSNNLTNTDIYSRYNVFIGSNLTVNDSDSVNIGSFNTLNYGRSVAIGKHCISYRAHEYLNYVVPEIYNGINPFREGKLFLATVRENSGTINSVVLNPIIVDTIGEYEITSIISRAVDNTYSVIKTYLSVLYINGGTPNIISTRYEILVNDFNLTMSDIIYEVVSTTIEQTVTLPDTQDYISNTFIAFKETKVSGGF